LPTVSNGTGRVLGLSLLDDWEPAAADEFDKLVPFGMAQPHHIVCLTDHDPMCVDDDLGTSSAHGQRLAVIFSIAFHLLRVSGDAEDGA
jgi:hypothetical protein